MSAETDDFGTVQEELEKKLETQNIKNENVRNILWALTFETNTLRTVNETLTDQKLRLLRSYRSLIYNRKALRNEDENALKILLALISEKKALTTKNDELIAEIRKLRNDNGRIRISGYERKLAGRVRHLENLWELFTENNDLNETEDNSENSEI
ncbi:MAG: hypothetical protein MHMPM18_002483 [Marteilia pararefringens]